MAENFFELMEKENQKKDITDIMTFNKTTQVFGLTLTEEDAKELVVYKNNTLKRVGRVEMGESILSKIIYVFCDSQYINQDNYLDTIETLQELFFTFKNESLDLLTDDELLKFMREQFENVSFGDLTCLGSTCLERFAAAIRSGYKGDIHSEMRWDKDLYLASLYDLLS
ncbi:MAG: DUF6323 family protein [Suipraeoptans sp.]